MTWQGRHIVSMTAVQVLDQMASFCDDLPVTIGLPASPVLLVPSGREPIVI
jgi:hypothetical protein